MTAAICVGAPRPANDAPGRAARAVRTLWAAAARLFAAAAESLTRGEAGREDLNLAAEKILGDYGNGILRLAYSYLHNMSDAEEVLQDTLLQFLKTAPQFESESHKKAWLFRVAGNLSKNRIDYNRVRGADELSEELVSEDRADLAFVWEAVKALPVKYREVIHLFYQEGYRTSEIASILRENEATVRARLSRGRAKLKEVLKEAYDFEE